MHTHAHLRICRPVERIERLIVADADVQRIHGERVKEHAVAVDFGTLLSDGEQIVASLRSALYVLCHSNIHANNHVCAHVLGWKACTCACTPTCMFVRKLGTCYSSQYIHTYITFVQMCWDRRRARARKKTIWRVLCNFDQSPAGGFKLQAYILVSGQCPVCLQRDAVSVF
jgi:hypothetical protein